jgi:hypothetical protein
LKWTSLCKGRTPPALQYKKTKPLKTSKRIHSKQDTKSLLNDFTIVDTKTSTFDENWKPVWESSRN